MAETLRDMVIQLIESDKEHTRIRSRGLFLKYWPEIKELLDEGIQLSKIWRGLKESGRIDTSYEVLRRQVARKRRRELAGEGSMTAKEITPPAPRLCKTEAEKISISNVEQHVNTADTTSASDYLKPVQFGRRRPPGGEKIF